jgi:hypothetical protein
MDAYDTKSIVLVLNKFEEAERSCFGGRIPLATGGGKMSEAGGHINQCSVWRCDTEEGADDNESAFRIDFKRFPEVIWILFGDRCGTGKVSSVADEDVDMAKFLLYRFEDGTNGAGIGNITNEGANSRNGIDLFELCFCFEQGFLCASDDDNGVCVCLGEGAGCGFPDALTAASNKYYLSLRRELRTRWIDSWV